MGITLYIFSIRDRVEQFAEFGYPGIFLIALLANATVLLPAPGVALIYAMGAIFNPIGVALAAGTGGALGELSGVDPDLLATAYEVFRERSLCERAEMEIRTVPALWACSACGLPIAPGQVLRCPVCQSPARLASGDEIVLEQIEMEVQ